MSKRNTDGLDIPEELIRKLTEGVNTTTTKIKNRVLVVENTEYIQQLQDQISILMASGTGNDAEIAVLRDQLAKCTSNLADCTTEKEKLEADIAIFRRDLEEAKKKNIKGLFNRDVDIFSGNADKSKLEQLETRFNDLRKKSLLNSIKSAEDIRQLRDQLAVLRDQLATCINEKKDLQDIIQQINIQLSDTNAKLEEAIKLGVVKDEYKNRLEVALENLQEQFDALQKTSTESDADKTRLEAELNALRNELDALQNKLDDCIVAKEDLNTRNITLKFALNESKLQNKDLRGQLDEFKTNLETANEQLADVTKLGLVKYEDNIRLTTDLQKIERQLQDLQENSKQRDVNKIQLQAQLDKLLAELDRLKTQLDECTKEKNLLEDQLAKFNAELAKAREELNEAKKLGLVKDEEKKRLTQKLQLIEQQFNKLQEESSDYSKQSAKDKIQLQNQLARLKAELARLKAELDECTEDKNYFKQEKTVFAKEIKEQRNLINGLKESLNTVANANYLDKQPTPSASPPSPSASQPISSSLSSSPSASPSSPQTISSSSLSLSPSASQPISSSSSLSSSPSASPSSPQTISSSALVGTKNEFSINKKTIPFNPVKPMECIVNSLGNSLVDMLDGNGDLKNGNFVINGLSILRNRFTFDFKDIEQRLGVNLLNFDQFFKICEPFLGSVQNMEFKQIFLITMAGDNKTVTNNLQLLFSNPYFIEMLKNMDLKTIIANPNFKALLKSENLPALLESENLPALLEEKNLPALLEEKKLPALLEEKKLQDFHVSPHELNPSLVTVCIIHFNTLFRIPNTIPSELIKEEVDNVKNQIKNDPIAIEQRKALKDVKITFDNQKKLFYDYIKNLYNGTLSAFYAATKKFNFIKSENVKGVHLGGFIRFFNEFLQKLSSDNTSNVDEISKFIPLFNISEKDTLYNIEYGFKKLVLTLLKDKFYVDTTDIIKYKTFTKNEIGENYDKKSILQCYYRIISFFIFKKHLKEWVELDSKELENHYKVFLLKVVDKFTMKEFKEYFPELYKNAELMNKSNYNGVYSYFIIILDQSYNIKDNRNLYSKAVNYFTGSDYNNLNKLLNADEKSKQIKTGNEIGKVYFISGGSPFKSCIYVIVILALLLLIFILVVKFSQVFFDKPKCNVYNIDGYQLNELSSWQ
jgi:hypothetical protein